MDFSSNDATDRPRSAQANLLWHCRPLASFNVRLTLSPVSVEADGNIFIGRYNAPVVGIVVMEHQGAGNYSGYWARSFINNERYQIPISVYSNSERVIMKILYGIFVIFLLNIGVSYAEKTKRWQTEWTNSDGSKSQTVVTFFRTKPDGRVANYGWSNGRLVGFQNSERFEGRWVQDKSGRRCKDIVDGSFYHGKVWFKSFKNNKRAFRGKWGYCDDTPNFNWRGWID